MRFSTDCSSKFSFFLAFVFFGFYLILSISDFFVPQYSSLFSYFYRLLSVVIFLYFILSYRGRVNFLSFSYTPIIIFFIFYFLALINSVFFNDVKIDGSPFYYLVFYLFVTLIPFLCLLLSDFNKLNEAIFFKYSLMFLLLTLVVVFINFFFTAIDARPYGGRLSTEAVNPIAVGHISVSAIIILSLCKNIFSTTKILLLAAFFYCLILSQSRGAMASLFFSFLMLFFVNFNWSLRIKIIKVVLLVVSLVFIYLFFLDVKVFESDLFETYKNIGSDKDLSTNIRFNSYIDSINQFFDSPFGGIIFEKNTMFYPHNLLLESLISVGVFGTASLFLQLIIVVFVGKKSAPYSSFSLVSIALFYQYFMGSFFSGAIYSNNLLWYFVAVVLSIYVSQAANKNNFFVNGSEKV